MPETGDGIHWMKQASGRNWDTFGYFSSTITRVVPPKLTRHAEDFRVALVFCCAAFVSFTNCYGQIGGCSIRETDEFAELACSTGEIIVVAF
jgi:hypothetical protein